MFSARKPVESQIASETKYEFSESPSRRQGQSSAPTFAFLFFVLALLFVLTFLGGVMDNAAQHRPAFHVRW